MSRGNCVSLCTHSKPRYVGYMYFWTVCMQMHLCLFEEKKIRALRSKLCLREMFCCSWGLRIFLKNKKKSHAKPCFCSCNSPNRRNIKVFVLACILTWVYWVFLEAGRLTEGVKSVYGITFLNRSSLYLEVAAARSFIQPLLNTYMWKCQRAKGWVSQRRKIKQRTEKVK